MPGVAQAATAEKYRWWVRLRGPAVIWSPRSTAIVGRARMLGRERFVFLARRN